jgi:hypothetical protein
VRVGASRKEKKGGGEGGGRLFGEAHLFVFFFGFIFLGVVIKTTGFGSSFSGAKLELGRRRG